MQRAESRHADPAWDVLLTLPECELLLKLLETAPPSVMEWPIAATATERIDHCAGLLRNLGARGL